MLTLLAIVACVASTAAAGAQSTDAPALTRMRRAIDSTMRVTHAPGVAVAITRGDSVIFAGGFGLANIETGERMTPDLLTHVGSVTKPLTAALVLSVIASGRLALDQPIGRAITGLSPAIAALTPRELLSQTSGLYDTPGKIGSHDETTLLANARATRNSALVLPRRAAFSYSNLGYSLAGLAAQQATDTAYADLLASRVLRPLRMTQSTMRPLEALTHPFAMGHELDTLGHVRIVRPVEDNTSIWPAGYLFSSARELSRFAIALANRGRVGGVQVLDTAIVDSMLAPRVEIPTMAGGLQYGYGLMLDNFAGLEGAWHPGSNNGHSALLRVIPSAHLGVVVLCNMDGVRIDRIAEGALLDVLGDVAPEKPTRVARVRIWRPATAVELRAAAGRYENRFVVDVVMRADTLRVTGFGPERVAVPIGVAGNGRLWLAISKKAGAPDTMIVAPATKEHSGFLSMFLWTLAKRAPRGQ